MKSRLLPAALALACAPAAHAQSPSPSPSPYATEYVEVTAKGLEEKVEEVPAAITVVGSAELRDRGAKDLRDAMASVAGVDVSPGGDGGPAGSVPEFMGLKEFDAFLLLQDDVPYGGAFNPALTTLTLEDVERIEVLRGPSPVMYGSTSFVGVLDVVHRDASDRFREAQASAGSYGSGSASIVSGLPQWAGFDSRFAVGFTRRGFADDRTGFDRGHGLWRNARTIGRGRFGFDVDFTLVNQDPASPHPRQGAALSTLVPLDANHNPEGAFIDDRRLMLTARYQRPVGSGAWETTLSFSHASSDIFRGFLASLSNTPGNARGIRGQVELNDVYFDSHVAWTPARWRLVAGADHLHGEGEALGGAFDYTTALAGDSGTSGLQRAVPEEDDIEDRREFTGVYAFVERELSSRFKLEAGLRFHRAMEEREDPRERAAEQAAGGGGEEEGEREDVKLTGTIAGEWTAWQRDDRSLRLYADFRSAFKPAAFDFGIGEGEEEGEEEALLEPETSRTYEIGLRSRLAEHVRVQASAFLVDFENLVVAATINGVPARRNAGKERFKGVEAELEWEMREHLQARASWALHDARFTDYVQDFDGVPTRLDDKRLELSAHHVGGAQLVWAPEHGLIAAADVHYVGSRFLNKRNTALAEGYTELGASVGWRARRWELRANARNLTDERPPVAESELGDAQYYRLPARQIEGEVRLRF